MNTTLWIFILVLTTLSYFILDDRRIAKEKCSHRRIQILRSIKVIGTFLIFLFPSDWMAKTFLETGNWTYLFNVAVIFVGFSLMFGFWHLFIYMLNTEEIDLCKKILACQD